MRQEQQAAQHLRADQGVARRVGVQQLARQPQRRRRRRLPASAHQEGGTDAVPPAAAVRACGVGMHYRAEQLVEQRDVVHRRVGVGHDPPAQRSKCECLWRRVLEGWHVRDVAAAQRPRSLRRRVMEEGRGGHDPLGGAMSCACKAGPSQLRRALQPAAAHLRDFLVPLSFSLPPSGSQNRRRRLPSLPRGYPSCQRLPASLPPHLAARPAPAPASLPTPAGRSTRPAGNTGQHRMHAHLQALAASASCPASQSQHICA